MSDMDMDKDTEFSPEKETGVDPLALVDQAQACGSPGRPASRSAGISATSAPTVRTASRPWAGF